MTTAELMQEQVTDTELFKQVMVGVAGQLGLSMDFLRDGNRVVFTGQNEQYELLNYDIGLNTHQSHIRAKNKSLCYELLNKQGVSAIEHFRLEKPEKSIDAIKEMTQKVKEQYSFPLVVKSNFGGGGEDVYFAFNETDLALYIYDMVQRGLTVAISPFYSFTTEYRCTVLDNEVVMSYGKIKPEDSLQHNLSKGAQVIDTPEHLKEEMYSIAIKANKALGLRFSNIDIVDTHEGLKVLEVNDSVALKRVVRNSVDRQREAINAYVKAITALRGD